MEKDNTRVCSFQWILAVFHRAQNLELAHNSENEHTSGLKWSMSQDVLIFSVHGPHHWIVTKNIHKIGGEGGI